MRRRGNSVQAKAHLATLWHAIVACTGTQAFGPKSTRSQKTSPHTCKRARPRVRDRSHAAKACTCRTDEGMGQGIAQPRRVFGRNPCPGGSRRSRPRQDQVRSTAEVAVPVGRDAGLAEPTQKRVWQTVAQEDGTLPPPHPEPALVRHDADEPGSWRWRRTSGTSHILEVAGFSQIQGTSAALRASTLRTILRSAVFPSSTLILSCGGSLA